MFAVTVFLLGDFMGLIVEYLCFLPLRKLDPFKILIKETLLLVLKLTGKKT